MLLFSGYSIYSVNTLFIIVFLYLPDRAVETAVFDSYYPARGSLLVKAELNDSKPNILDEKRELFFALLLVSVFILKLGLGLGLIFTFSSLLDFFSRELENTNFLRGFSPAVYSLLKLLGLLLLLSVIVSFDCLDSISLLV